MDAGGAAMKLPLFSLPLRPLAEFVKLSANASCKAVCRQQLVAAHPAGSPASHGTAAIEMARAWTAREESPLLGLRGLLLSTLLAFAPAAGMTVRAPRKPSPPRTLIGMPPDGLLTVEGRAAQLAHWRPIQNIYAAEAAMRAAAAEDSSAGSSDELAEMHQMLTAAGFRPLSSRDIALSSALNVNYLWRLSLAAQMSGLDPTLAADLGEGSERLYGGRAVLWCRGYGSEASSGRLLLPKLDYLQAALVQRAAASLALAILRVRAGTSNAAQRAALATPLPLPPLPVLGDAAATSYSSAVSAAISATQPASQPAAISTAESATKPTAVAQLPIRPIGS
ncbi:hypothetical protein T492DRAFT_872829 [Pavlovales sp. CCMP2436]|nr:hypothetical protein T492DRAFT_872829 [Pavlovales sp. CCMP2436]